MKSIKFLSFFLIATLAIASCSKEEVTPQIAASTSAKITLDDNRIIFDTYSDYENHINEYHESEEPQKFIANFKSNYHLNESRSGSSLPEELQDDFLMSILNENDVVQIGDYLYKVNLLTDKVYVLNVYYISEYSDLVSENATNINVMEFSVGDDVIDLVEGLADNTSRSCGGIGGGEYPFPEKILGTVNGTEVSMAGGVKFFRAGIYFALSGIVKYYPQSSSLLDNVQVALHMASPGCWYKKRPCRNQDIRVKNPGYILTWGEGNNKQAKMYSGMRNLNGYYMFVRGRGALIEDNGTWFNIQNASTYGGRNINSPW